MSFSNKDYRKAISWLKLVTMKMESDPEFIENIPIENIREELISMGANNNKFKKKLATKYMISKMIIKISSLWNPMWTGEFVTASDIPNQSYSFSEEFGTIDIVCNWKPSYGNTPAYISLSWKADITINCELWARFENPETHNVLSEICLGTSLIGEEFFTSEELEFNPSCEKWAISIIFVDTKKKLSI